jgi:hypothetical protein
MAQIHPETQKMFKDACAVEFLGLPQGRTEDGLHRGLLDRMKGSIASTFWRFKERTNTQSHS